MNRRIYRGLVVLIVVAVGAAGVMFWYYHRPLPAAVTNQPLFPGITYTREIRSHPRAMIIHVVSINLTTPGLSFLTTPHDDIGTFTYAARTTSEFLQMNRVQLAINADFFEPWWYNSLTDYYPHEGDGTNTNGPAVSRGMMVSGGYDSNFDTLYLTADNHASFTPPDAPVYTAISGIGIFLAAGQPTLADTREPYLADPQPRTAIGLSADSKTLLLMVVDGRQPNYSEGATIAEITALMLEYGADTAMNLDGGGSSTLVIEGADGGPQVLNSPIHARIPGLQRPVANHFGVLIGNDT